MAREVKIKVKQIDGNLGFTKVDLPENYQTEFNQNLDRSQKNGETIIRETREYELITPLFGGGAENKKADEISIIRATEIRGHLRFWWRATRGGQFATIKELKEHEDAIFGSTESHSALQIEVEISNRGRDFPNQGDNQPIDSIKSPFSYVAFPLRGENKAKVIENVSFTIKFSIPKKYNDDLKTTFWAWEMFGGIGARTRRGFGALSLKKINEKVISLPSSDQIKSFTQTSLENFIKSEDFHENIPHLSKNISYCFTKKQDSSVKVWKFLTDKLQSFRQYRRNKDTGQVSKFGASQWSEPNALRYRMKKRDSKPNVDKFPRANFGLPILFEMKHDNFKTTLKGKGKKEGEFIERLSSPLIFRPIKCSDGVVGIALILHTPRFPPYGLTLTDVKREAEISSELTTYEARDLTENLELLDNNTDVLQAFLDYLEK